MSGVTLFWICARPGLARGLFYHWMISVNSWDSLGQKGPPGYGFLAPLFTQQIFRGHLSRPRHHFRCWGCRGKENKDHAVVILQHVWIPLCDISVLGGVSLFLSLSQLSSVLQRRWQVFTSTSTRLIQGRVLKLQRQQDLRRMKSLSLDN